MTLEQAQTLLSAYILAETQLLTGHQSVTIGDKSITLADLADVQRGRKELTATVQALSSASSTGSRTRTMQGAFL